MNLKITGIQRFSTNDGPGIRTLVYFAGCGMRCQWCHNPETQKKIICLWMLRVVSDVAPVYVSAKREPVLQIQTEES